MMWDFIYIWTNTIFGDSASKWYLINAITGLLLMLIPGFYWIIVKPLQVSYQKYQQEKQDLFRTIDEGK